MLDLRLMCAGGGGAGGPLHPVPKVIASTIRANQLNGIHAHWDRPMAMSCDIKSQISVTAGGVAVLVQRVEFNHFDESQMSIIVGEVFQPGQVVTWAYDDSGACDLHGLDPPNDKAVSQTYSVVNNLEDGSIIDGIDNIVDGTYNIVDI